MARYTERTKEAILEEMLDMIDPSMDKREGSIIFDMTSPAAVQLALVYIQLDVILELMFASTANGDSLTNRAEEVGLTRKAAVASTGFLVFTGTPGTVIPVGSQASTDSAEPITYSTTAAGVIASNGEVKVAAKSDVTGIVANAAMNMITLVIGNLSGVSGVTNPAPFEGGTDAETDDALRDRFFSRVRQPATSGNLNHYIQWAKEVQGVGDARAFSFVHGDLTVETVIINDERRAPSQTIIDRTLSYILTMAPFGAIPSVVGATEVPMNISVDVTIASDTTIEDVTELIRTACIAYFKALAFNDSLIRISRIQAIILDIPRIIDYANLSLNGLTNSNIELEDTEIPVLGTLNVGVMT